MPGLYLAGVNLVEVGCNFDVNIALWAAPMSASAPTAVRNAYIFQVCLASVRLRIIPVRAATMSTATMPECEWLTKRAARLWKSAAFQRPRSPAAEG